MSKEKLLTQKWWLFTLATQSICVYGEDDFSSERYMPTRALAQSLIEPNLSARIEWVKKKRVDEPERVQERCVWIMKRILR